MRERGGPAPQRPARHRDDSATVWYRIRDAMAGKSKPGKIHLRIVEVMKRFPGGISGGQIRQELEKEGLEPGDQTHLDRRKRDLKKWFVISKDLSNIVVAGKNRRVTLYKYVGVRRKVVDEGQPSLKERAEVIHGAHGRCQMCGKSVAQAGAVFLLRVNDSRKVSLTDLCFTQTWADRHWVRPLALPQAFPEVS
jgi:hypothetical protein